MPKVCLIAVLCIVIEGLTAATCRSETLTDAWCAAVANSSRLSAAEYQREAASYDLGAAQAERNPDASLQSAYTVRSSTPSFIAPSVAPGVGQFPYAQQNSASAGAQIRTPIYTSGRISHSISRAEAALSAADHNAAATRSDLLFTIGEAYLAVLRSQRELEVTKQDLASRTAYAAEVGFLHEQQRAPRTDLLAAQVTQAKAAQNCSRCEHFLQTARARYNRLLGRSLVAPVELEELRIPALPQSLEQLEQMAWQKRPELLQIKAQSSERISESERLLAERGPQVSILGRFDYVENRFQTPQGIASAAVVVDWNPLDGGRKSRAANAELSRAARFNQLFEDFKSQVSLDLLSAWHDRQEASERLEVSAKTAESAEENLRVARVRYASGMAIQSEVLEAQTRRTQVARDYYEAIYDLALSQLRLRHAAGLLEIGVTP